MEIWQVLGNLSPGVAVGVLCLYFYNQLTLKYLDERKEMLQQMVAERKEWNEALEKLLDRYDTRLQAAVDMAAKMGAEMHALRGRVQEFLTTLETRLLSIENRLSNKGGSRD